MGMYDDLAFENPHPKAVCAAGHLVNNFQTKDFECLLDKYLVRENLLYRSQFGAADDSPEPQEDVWESSKTTLTAHVYTSCSQCPVVYTRQNSNHTRPGTPWISEHRPWCEFAVTFKKGVLVDVEPVEQETVESVREERLKHQDLDYLQGMDYRVVEPDDPEVQAFLKGGRNNLYFPPKTETIEEGNPISKAQEEILQQRKEIDSLDDSILDLLVSRIATSRKLGVVKRGLGLPLRDHQREAEILERIAKKAITQGLSSEEIKDIYRAILTLSRHHQTLDLLQETGK